MKARIFGMISKVLKLSGCRNCNSHNLHLILDFPSIPLVDNFLTLDQLGKEFVFPLSIYVCQQCYLVQTQHEIDVAEYYRDYHYSAAHSPFAQNFMHRLAEAILKEYSLNPGESVLEIGSSDGYQLACFRDLGMRVFGFEPSEFLVNTSRQRGINVAQSLFLPDTLDLIPTNLLPFKVALLTYTFDHLSDPVEFLKSIYEVLDPNGLLIIEVHDLAKIIDRREYCLFAHEHTTYYSEDTMREVLYKGGFDLINSTLIPEFQRRGNSLLIVAKPRYSNDAQKFRQYQAFPQLSCLETYYEFSKQVTDSLAKFCQYIQFHKSQGQKLAGYGAGGRGIMTLSMTDVSNDEIAYLSDQNNEIHGYYTPKSHIPIVSPDYVLKNWVDELIVFSFGYMDEIANSLASYTAQGGQLTSLLELF
jgi:SAM-dependent methyltransferase